MSVLSKRCEYGIRAILYVSSLDRSGFVPIREISDKTHISFHYLTKILQTLTNCDIMTSFRGAKGGVSLARRPEEINLLEIVNALEGPGVFGGCILGLPKCDDTNPCILHSEWSKARKILWQVFETMSLKKMLDKVQEENLRFYEIPEQEEE